MKLATLKTERSSTSAYKLKEYRLGLFIVLSGNIFVAIALEYGTIVLISITSCFCVVFTAILSPMILKEKFMWKVDGLSISLICVGCTLALLQQPKNVKMVEIAPEAINDYIYQKLHAADTIIFMTVIFAISVTRKCLHKTMKNSLDKFFSDVVKNYMRLKEVEDALCDSTYDTDEMTRTI